MNTVSIIVSILIPLIVVVYIIVDLFSKRTVKPPVMLYDKEIENAIHETGRNHGDRLTQQEILDNTKYILEQYNDIL
jgi:hypothetical protein